MFSGPQPVIHSVRIVEYNITAPSLMMARVSTPWPRARYNVRRLVSGTQPNSIGSGGHGMVRLQVTSHVALVSALLYCRFWRDLERGSALLSRSSWHEVRYGKTGSGSD